MDITLNKNQHFRNIFSCQPAHTLFDKLELIIKFYAFVCLCHYVFSQRAFRTLLSAGLWNYFCKFLRYEAKAETPVLWRGQLEIMQQMSRQEYRGSAGEYQADEQAGVARLRWRVSGR